VEHVDSKTNQVTVRTDGDRNVTYEPRRLQGVTLYRETERAFAVGDRVQMTAPDRERGVPNRSSGQLSASAETGAWTFGGTPVGRHPSSRANAAILILDTR
jgi:hypothetical protein